MENLHLSSDCLDSLGMLFPDRQRRPYYIVAPHYSRLSAGVKVMHTLCHLLNLRGQSAFITTPLVESNLVTPVLTEAIADQHYQEKATPIVVYPEILFGNPLEALCVVRYIMNVPGLLGGPVDFDPGELLIWYGEAYRKAHGGHGPVLSLPSTDARRFRPPPSGTSRQGSCFYAGKFRDFANEELSPVTRDSIEIFRAGPGVQSQEEVIELFQRCEIFYCYESTALVLEAMLCGCVVVLIPNKHMPVALAGAPFDMAGIAWGTEPQEVERARQTLWEVPQRYELWVKWAFEQLRDFIDLTQTKARAVPYTNKIKLADPFVPIAAPAPESAFKHIIKQVIPPIVLGARRKVIQATSRIALRNQPDDG